MQPRLLDGSPPGTQETCTPNGWTSGTQETCTPNGWTSGEVFLNWMHFLIEQLRPTADKKVLVLLDNHESHKYYPAIEYGTKNNVVILSLASHTTRKMLPTDVAIHGPLKTHFEREVNIFQKSQPDRIINQYDVSRLLAPAFLKAAVGINSVHAFERCGIWPVNKHAFGDEHFAPTEAHQI
ncbi:DDE superfamily endonuclease [Popillia japonica]|uniref:DDE superfamily endonuclease n=1 Tax=Popillia japonica TaxID=7064 RepID=A0AAW1L9D7_POPJA